MCKLIEKFLNFPFKNSDLLSASLSFVNGRQLLPFLKQTNSWMYLLFLKSFPLPYIIWYLSVVVKPFNRLDEKGLDDSTVCFVFLYCTYILYYTFVFFHFFQILFSIFAFLFPLQQCNGFIFIAHVKQYVFRHPHRIPNQSVYWRSAA